MLVTFSSSVRDDQQEMSALAVILPSVLKAIRVSALLMLVQWTFANADEVLPELGNTLVGHEFVYTVQAGDSLTSIGARFAQSPAILASANGLKRASKLSVGATLMIDNRHIVPRYDLPEGIVLNVPQRMLFHFREGSLRASYPVGLGRPDWPTPIGRFKVLRMQKDKEWIVPESIQEEMRQAGKEVLTHVSPGPENPLGRHWIGLSLKNIGIHGTIAPPSVYHFQSHGCIRLHPDDVAELFANVAVGEAGEIVYQPLLMAQVDGRLYLEVQPDIYKRAANPTATVRRIVAAQQLDTLVDWARIDAVIAEQAGLARDVGRVQSQNTEDN